MKSLSLVGPSYGLRFGRADCERTINYEPVQIESGQGAGGASFYLKQTAGLRSLVSLGGELRGLYVADGALFAAVGGSLVEVSRVWSATVRGTLPTSSGIVSMAANKTQLAVVDGVNLYVHTLSTHTGTANPANFLGSSLVDVIDGYGVFSKPGGSDFQLSAADDFTTIDALDYESAMGSVGNLSAFIVKHRELVLLKDKTGEVWYDAGGSDFPLSRNDGANIEIGCDAPHSLRKKGGVAFWLGRDETGGRAVFQMQAYTPQRISTRALEEALEAVDVSQASAFVYSHEGLSYYVLQVPGLSSTWVYEMASGLWHERADFVDGEFTQWRGQFHAYAYGVHVIGDTAGNLYAVDSGVNKFGADPIVRERQTPHDMAPTLERKRHNAIQILCDVGHGLPDGSAPQLMLSYSNDSGTTWGSWRYLSLGNIGQYKARARATMLGSARDRVWRIRITDDVPCNLISAVVDSQ